MNRLQVNDSTNDIDKIITNFGDFKNRETQLEKVYQIFDIYGVGHGCLQTEKRSNFSTNAVWRVTPDDVSTACSKLAKTNKHPAIMLAKNRYFPFDLFDFKDLFDKDPDVMNLYSAFENNGLKNAYGLPVHTGTDEIFVFVIGRPNGEINSAELLSLQAVCTNAVNHILQLERRPCESKKVNKLSKFESQILISIARGKNYSSIAEEQGLSEMTINTMLKLILEKTGASNSSQAILLSIIEGEFSLSDCITAN